MPTPPIPVAERKRRKAAVEAALKQGFAPHRSKGGKGSSVSEAARILGVNRNTMDSFIRNEEGLQRSGQEHFMPDWNLFEEQTPPEATVEEEKTQEQKTTEQALRDDVQRLRAELRQAYRASAEEDAILNLIGIIAKAPSNPPAWIAAPAVKRVHKAPEVPVMMWSDWHGGERIDPHMVNGYNAFNIEILEERVERLLVNSLDLCVNHIGGNYPGLVLNLLGDFISGGLHPELIKTDEEGRIPSTLRVRDLLVAAIKRLLEHFPALFVPCVSGNHGRETAKPEFKGYVYHNFDWLIYQLLQREFAGDKRVQFMIDPSNEAYYNVFGHTFLAVHGDMLGVRGGDGIIGAIGPIMRGEVKTRGQSTSLGRPYDYILMGHWHQMIWLPRGVVNNALKGFDEYAKNSLRATPSHPSQALFFVHEKGITGRWEVRVDDQPRRDNPGWIAVPDIA